MKADSIAFLASIFSNLCFHVYRICNSIHWPNQCTNHTTLTHLPLHSAPLDTHPSLGMCASSDAHMPITKPFGSIPHCKQFGCRRLSSRSHSPRQLRCRPPKRMYTHDRCTSASQSTLFMARKLQHHPSITFPSPTPWLPACTHINNGQRGCTCASPLTLVSAIAITKYN